MKKIIALLLTLLLVLPPAVRAAQAGPLTVEIVGEVHGTAELLTGHAAPGDTVWLRAEPEEGYLVRIDGPEELRVCYAGLGLYSLTMPDEETVLQLRFVPAQGEVYAVTATVSDPALGALTLSRTAAREGEWVVLEAVPAPGCLLLSVTAVGADGLPVRGGYAGTRDGRAVYEYCLPNADIQMEAVFARQTQDPVRDRLRPLTPQITELRVNRFLC